MKLQLLKRSVANCLLDAATHVATRALKPACFTMAMDGDAPKGDANSKAIVIVIPYEIMIECNEFFAKRGMQPFEVIRADFDDS